MGLNECQLIELPKHSDTRGSVTFVEDGVQIPFAIKRVYYLYDVAAEQKRGAHAHKNLQQLVIAVAGSFDVVLDDGVSEKIISLNKPDVGLIVTAMIWREIVNFSSGAVCLVLASEHYDEADYYRDYSQFCQATMQAES